MADEAPVVSAPTPAVTDEAPVVTPEIPDGVVNEPQTDGELDFRDPAEEFEASEVPPVEEASDDKAQEEEPQVSKPAIDSLLTIRAIRAGFSDEEIASVTDTKALEMAVRRVEALSRKQQEAQAPAKPVEVEKDWEPDLSDDFDPAIKANLKALYAEAKKQAEKHVAPLKADLERALAYVDEQKMAVLEQQLDNLFTGAGEEYKDVFGSKAMKASAAAEQANRMKVLQEMHVMETGYREAGGKVPAMKELHERAVRNLFGQRAKQAVRQELSNQLKQHSKQLLTRPTGKAKGEIPFGTSRAIAAVHAAIQKSGQQVEDDGF